MAAGIVESEAVVLTELVFVPGGTGVKLGIKVSRAVRKALFGGAV
jgi:hypothetical protein